MTRTDVEHGCRAPALLESQHQPQAGVDRGHLPAGQPLDSFREEPAVERHDLGDVDDGLLAEPRDPPTQQRVPRRPRQLDVRRDDGGDDRGDAASIEVVRLQQTWQNLELD